MEDGLAGCAQFRQPAQREYSARKSLALAVVCRSHLTIASIASLPLLLLVSAILEESSGWGRRSICLICASDRGCLDIVHLISLVYQQSADLRVVQIQH
jgi:hypothetical protein